MTENDWERPAGTLPFGDAASTTPFGNAAGSPPFGDAAGAPVETTPPTYPRIPAGAAPPPAPAPPPAGISGARLVLVALVAALIGGLLAGGVTLAASRRNAGDVAAPPPPPAQPVQAATVEVQDGGGLTQVEAVAAAVVPSVVQIDVEGAGRAGGGSGNGSGVVYRSDGHILTNNHVVAGADELRVVFSDGTMSDAEVVGRDPLTDLAVLRVDRSGLAAVQIGDSDALRVGQLAIAIGSPFGLEGSVTAGVVSALERPISVGNGIRLPDVVQTDAAINPGNSGGALVGADGRLIGINSAILTSGTSRTNAGVGFAIPVDIAVRVADELIASGAVVYPFLGVEGTDVPPGAAQRLGVDKGALIEAVQPGTPAADAGLQPQDVIVRIGTTPVESMDDLIIAIREADVGDTVSITYLRGGRERSADVTLVERPE